MNRHNFKKLNIWQEGLGLVVKTYKMTNTFPSKEKYGLISQLNRCSVSIPSNIAEGTSKSSEKHFRTFLEISLGSAFEWETQIIIAEKLKYISSDEFEDLESRITQLQKMISGFIGKLDC